MTDNYRSKIDQAKIIFAQHNYLRSANRIDVDDFMKKLRLLGGTNDITLKRCTEVDLIECGLPKLVARQVVDIFQELVPPGVLETGQEGRLVYGKGK